MSTIWKHSIQELSSCVQRLYQQLHLFGRSGLKGDDPTCVSPTLASVVKHFCVQRLSSLPQCEIGQTGECWVEGEGSGMLPTLAGTLNSPYSFSSS